MVIAARDVHYLERTDAILGVQMEFGVGWRYFRFWGAVALAVLFALSVIIFLPAQVQKIDGVGPKATDALRHLADTRTTLVQLLGGFGGAVAVYLTWRNFLRASSEAADARKQALEARVAGDYIKAIEQLSGIGVSARAGGAFALGRLLLAVEPGTADYWAIMDVLTTFVRDRAAIENASGEKTRPERDVEAALNVLARRRSKDQPKRDEDSPVDLSGCDLTGAWLAGAKLSEAFFGGCRLTDVEFDKSDLKRANFDRATLSGASFTGSDIAGAFFSKANIDGADFNGTDTGSANFSDEQRASLKAMSSQEAK